MFALYVQYFTPVTTGSPVNAPCVTPGYLTGFMATYFLGVFLTTLWSRFHTTPISLVYIPTLVDTITNIILAGANTTISRGIQPILMCVTMLKDLLLTDVLGTLPSSSNPRSHSVDTAAVVTLALIDTEERYTT